MNTQTAQRRKAERYALYLKYRLGDTPALKAYELMVEVVQPKIIQEFISAVLGRYSHRELFQGKRLSKSYCLETRHKMSTQRNRNELYLLWQRDYEVAFIHRMVLEIAIAH
jgi:hypothetical protein